jgi:hypothetical protein
MTIREMRGIQWGKAQIKVLEGGRVHENFFLLKNDRYDCDKGEERNPRDRSQIMVPTGSIFFLFYSCRVIL